MVDKATVNGKRGCTTVTWRAKNASGAGWADEASDPGSDPNAAWTSRLTCLTPSDAWGSATPTDLPSVVTPVLLSRRSLRKLLYAGRRGGSQAQRAADLTLIKPPEPNTPPVTPPAPTPEPEARLSRLRLKPRPSEALRAYGPCSYTPDPKPVAVTPPATPEAR